jgi:hypothetical protein
LLQVPPLPLTARHFRESIEADYWDQ